MTKRSSERMMEKTRGIFFALLIVSTLGLGSFPAGGEEPASSEVESESPDERLRDRQIEKLELENQKLQIEVRNLRA